MPLIQTATRVEYFYSIYIMDMAFVFPALIILGVLAAKQRGLGLLLLPVAFVKGFTLLFFRWAWAVC